MARNISPYKHTLNINRMVMRWLYPRLRELPPAAWESMLGKTRDTNFDTVEWVATLLPNDIFIHNPSPV